MEITIKIADVTFNNKDGTPRQSILKSFGDGCFITVNLLKEAFQNKETGKTELAIACIEKITKQQLGFIPRINITPDIMNVRQMTGLVKYYEPEGTFYCELTETQAPSSETYADVKRICESNNLTMPAYDIRAYTQFAKWLEKSQRCGESFAEIISSLLTLENT